MKQISLLIASIFTLGAALAQPIVFTNVNVVKVDAGVTMPGMTVVVDGGRIAAVGESLKVEMPAQAKVINARGKYLIPGLWDMHAHTSSDRITREVLYPLLIAHGVTGIRNMRADCFESGPGACGPVDSSISQARARQRDVRSGHIVGPREILGSAFANGPEHGGISTVQGAGTAEHARDFVRLAHERGVDFIKIYDRLPRAAYFALADEAKRAGMPFAGHVPVAVRASEASDAGQRSVEHCCAGSILEECSSREATLRPRVVAELASDEPEMLPLMLEMVDTYDAKKCSALFTKLAKNITWFTPTLMVARLPSEIGVDWREDPRLRYLPPEERAFFESMEERDVMGDAVAQEPYTRWARGMVRDMHEVGVPLLAGSDAGSWGVFWGWSLHEELALLVKAGLSEAESLRAATLGPAEFLEMTDSMGTVAAGKVADLVLLRENPLQDIANTQRIEAVVTRGRLLDRETLDAMLDDVLRAAKDE